jgi:hypothetical protein
VALSFVASHDDFAWKLGQFLADCRDNDHWFDDVGKHADDTLKHRLGAERQHGFR